MTILLLALFALAWFTVGVVAMYGVIRLLVRKGRMTVTFHTPTDTRAIEGEDR